MIRLALAAALACATLSAPTFVSSALADETPAAAAPVKHRWVGATVIDRNEEVVGVIDRLVPGFSGPSAEIIIRGHRAAVPVKGLTMDDEGKVHSKMTKADIYRTSPAYGA